MLYRGGPKPRSNLRSHRREIRQAAKGERPEPFGIRRPLEEEAQERLKLPFEKLLRDNRIPDALVPRESLKNTLLRQRMLDKQLGRGIIIGYEFAKKQEEGKERVAQECTDNIVAELGEVVIINGRVVALELISDDLEHDHNVVADVFSSLGIVSTRAATIPLHVSLGESRDFMSKLVQGEVSRVVNDVMPVGETILLTGIEFYTNPSE